MTPTKIVQNAITSPLKCGIFLDELMFGNELKKKTIYFNQIEICFNRFVLNDKT